MAGPGEACKADSTYKKGNNALGTPRHRQPPPSGGPPGRVAGAGTKEDPMTSAYLENVTCRWCGRFLILCTCRDQPDTVVTDTDDSEDCH